MQYTPKPISSAETTTKSKIPVPKESVTASCLRGQKIEENESDASGSIVYKTVLFKPPYKLRLKHHWVQTPPGSQVLKLC